MATPVADLVVRVGANIAGLVAAGQKGAQALGRLGSATLPVIRRMSRLALAASGAAAALGTLLVKRGLEAGDTLAKTADKLGLATDALGGLRHAAKLTGVEAGTLDLAIQRMVRRVAEAAQGTGEAKDAIRELGLSAKDLNKLAPDKQMQALADAMARVATDGDKVRLAMKLFDSEGVALVNTLKLGSKGLREAQAEAQALGVTLTRIDAAKIEKANDAWTRAKTAIQGVGNRLAVKLAPFIEDIANKFVDAAKRSGGFKDTINAVVDFGITALGKLADAGHLFAQGFRVVGGTIALAAAAAAHWAGNVEAAGKAMEIANRLRDQFQQGLKEPWPSAAVEEWRKSVETAADKAAKAIADAIEKGRNRKTNQPPPGPTKAEVDARKKMEEKLQALREFLMTERELETFQYQERLDDLQKFHAARLLTDTEQAKLRLKIEQDHFDALKGLQQRAAEEQNRISDRMLSNTAGTLSALSSIFDREGSKQFKLSKTLAIASALVSTYQGIAAGLKLGWPASIPAVAFAAATGFAQVASIRATTKNGGGGGGGGAGGGTAPAPSADTGPSRSAFINISGLGAGDGLFSKEQVRRLITQINEESGDGVNIILA